MNNITEITKRDIFDLFINGYIEEYAFGANDKKIYYYYGRLDEIEFLNKLYPLDVMPSRYYPNENARYDIIRHTIGNDDWELGWVFSDDRFELSHGSDVKLLNFLCAVFHPENRQENGYWLSVLERINQLLKQDGYELYEESKISGRAVYAYRKISPEEIASNKFVPFSIRNKKTADNSLSISKLIRREIYNLFTRHNETQLRTTETNWNYKINSKEALIEDIKEHYTPKAFSPSGIHEETNNLEQFVISNYPCYVFDAIELFSQYNIDVFTEEVNLIFKNHSFPFKLAGGKIGRTKPIIKTKEIIKEEGLKELIDQASLLYHNNTISDKQIAVEKLWDAFERLKTYYGSANQKKTSVTKIIDDISNNDGNFINLFNEEFVKLTNIGNDYRIRHHEMDKIAITDSNHYDYLFQRCFALIDLALKYLK
jgi:hypothetical protein